MERFFLSHPEVMRFHFDARPWVYGVAALICLGLAVGLRDERTNFEMVAPPVRAIRCFRFCWLAGFPATVVEAHNLARGTETQGWALGFQLLCYLLWLMLLVAGIGGMLSACFQEAKQKKAT